MPQNALRTHVCPQSPKFYEAIRAGPPVRETTPYGGSHQLHVPSNKMLSCEQSQRLLPARPVPQVRAAEKLLSTLTSTSRAAPATVPCSMRMVRIISISFSWHARHYSLDSPCLSTAHCADSAELAGGRLREKFGNATRAAEGDSARSSCADMGRACAHEERPETPLLHCYRIAPRIAPRRGL